MRNILSEVCFLVPCNRAECEGETLVASHLSRDSVMT